MDQRQYLEVAFYFPSISYSKSTYNTTQSFSLISFPNKIITATPTPFENII